MKNYKKLLFLVVLLALMQIIPLHAQAAQSWTAYGRPGHASASGDVVTFAGHPIRSTIGIMQAECASLPAGREPLRLPEPQRALPPAQLPQLPAPKLPNIELKGR